MRHLVLPLVLFVGGVVGFVVCVLRFLLLGEDHPLAGALALVCIALGFQELRFELRRDIGEASE